MFKSVTHDSMDLACCIELNKIMYFGLRHGDFIILDALRKFHLNTSKIRSSCRSKTTLVLELLPKFGRE